MMRDRIGVGIVGLSASGRWAATAHVPALRAIPDFEIRGLAASNRDSAAAAAAKFDIGFHTDTAAELTQQPDIDLIVIAVKLPYHYALAKAAIDAGKMVYCEWPLGVDLAEARKLASLAAESGVKTFVGLQAPSAPPIRYLEQLLSDGYVGDVLSTSVLGALGVPWSDHVPPGSEYLQDKRNGATMLSIPLAHTLEGMRSVLGDFATLSATLAIRRKQACIAGTEKILPVTVPDQVAVTGILEGGAFANIHYRAVSSRNTGFLWEISGTKGDLIVRGKTGHLQYGMIDIFGGRNGGKEVTALPVPDRFTLVDLPKDSLSYTVGHAYLNVLNDIRNETQNVPSFIDALGTHALIETIERASDTGQRQTFRRS